MYRKNIVYIDSVLSVVVGIRRGSWNISHVDKEGVAVHLWRFKRNSDRLVYVSPSLI